MKMALHSFFIIIYLVLLKNIHFERRNQLQMIDISIRDLLKLIFIWVVKGLGAYSGDNPSSR